MSSETIKEEVKSKYGEAARRVAGGATGSCCATTCCGADNDPITRDLYDDTQKGLLPEAAVVAIPLFWSNTRPLVLT